MKMSWQTWVIIGLIVLNWYAYTYPDKAQKLTEPVFGKVNEFIKVKNPLNKETVKDICPDTISKVCGEDGKTYDNMCKAALAGILKATPGECE